MGERIVVVLSEEGDIKEQKIVEGSFEEIVKKVAEEALGKWDPGTSDFTVIRSYLELRYKLPINPDLYDKLLELNLEMFREGNELIVKLPVFTISFDNKWLEESYIDRKIYVVAPFLDNESLSQIVDYAREATKGPKQVSVGQEGLRIDEEALKRLEEGLKEAEELEESKPKRRSRKRR